jgi:hypothetical protein
VSIGEANRARRFAEVALAPAGGRYRESLANLAFAEALRAQGEDSWQEARQYYQEALTTAEAIGSRSIIARAALGSGLLAMAEGRDGMPLLRRARDLAAELGIAAWQQKAERALSS